MAQQRFFNWKEEDSTFLLSQRLSGFFVAGRYAGYDFTPTANMILTLGSSVSGMTTRKITGSPYTVSVAQTNQGMTLFEDAPVTLPIGAVGGLPRIDMVVLTHSQTQNPGGALGLYSVVQGTPNATPVKPAIPTPDTQIEIGSLYLPASVTALNQPGIIWTQSKVSAMETKASSTDTEALFLLNSYVSDALGKALSLQTNKAQNAYPPLPPILIYGGVDDNPSPDINPGYIYYDGEILRILQGDIAGTGSIIVWDVLGVSPFKEAKPRLSLFNDGDFSNNDLRLFYDILLEKTEGVWENISPSNGWQTGVLLTADYFPFQYKKQGNKIYLRGALLYETASPPTSDIITPSMPFSFLKKTRQYIYREDAGYLPIPHAYLECDTNGQLRIISASATDQIYLLDGVVLWID